MKLTDSGGDVLAWTGKTLILDMSEPFQNFNDWFKEGTFAFILNGKAFQLQDQVEKNKVLRCVWCERRQIYAVQLKAKHKDVL